MDAIILAGGNLKPDDPLYSENPNGPKSLIDVAGAPMVVWVLEAIKRARSIGEIIIVGLDELPGHSSNESLHLLPDQGGLLENAESALSYAAQIRPDNSHILVASADIPALTSEIVDWRVASFQNLNHDVDYAVVTRQTMEARFPNAQRSYIKLRDHELCGGDLNILRVGLVQDREFWTRVVQARKSPFRQARMIGVRFLLLAVTRRLTLLEAQEYVKERLGLQGQATISPFAEVAMDIDKPAQLTILREELSKTRSQ